MSGFKRVLGGLLSGVGAGMQKNEEMKQQQARDDVLYRRQLALESLSQGNRVELEGIRSSNQIANTREELGIRGKLAAEDDARGMTAAEAKAKREDQSDAAKQDREFKIWLKKQPIELQNKLTLADHDSALTLARDLKKGEIDRGNTVAGRGVDSDGNLVIIKGNDAVVTGRGIKPIQGQGGADGIMDLYGEGGGAAPARTGLPTASPTSPAKQTITARERSNLYNEASQKAANGDPRYKGLNASQIKAKVDDLLLNSGYTLAD